MPRGSRHVYRTGNDASSSDKENVRPETCERFTDASDSDDASEDRRANGGGGGGSRQEETEDDGGWHDADEREGLSDRFSRIVCDGQDRTLQPRTHMDAMEKRNNKRSPLQRVSRGTRKEESEDDGRWHDEVPLDADEREGLDDRLSRIACDVQDRTLQSRINMDVMEKFNSKRSPLQRVSILDVQGYRRNGVFVLKSIGVLDVYEFKLIVLHFKPPVSAKTMSPADAKTNAYIREVLSGRPWESGEISYNKRSAILSPLLTRYDRVYLKGEEKILWMTRHTRCERERFVDLIDYGCPSLDECIYRLRYFMFGPGVRMPLQEWTGERVVSNVLSLFYWIDSTHTQLLFPRKSKRSPRHVSPVVESFAKDADHADARDLIHRVSITNTNFFLSSRRAILFLNNKLKC